MSVLEPTSCLICIKKHGTIIDISLLKLQPEIPAHNNCKCTYVPMRTLSAGTATNDGVNGADYAVFYFSKLPNCYISFHDALKSGWIIKKGNLDRVLPGKSIGGDVFLNNESKLPSKQGRVWYEADINYTGGYRNRQRLLYSSDGLLFVTYDHYKTFYEITT